jgi:hypothetical protein
MKTSQIIKNQYDLRLACQLIEGKLTFPLIICLN